MTEPSAVLVELTRGGIVESVHRGAVAVCRPSGEVTAAWGDPGRVILPRSACKMLQALPLVESGAAAGLGTAELALACASHQGAAIHTDRVGRWLTELGLAEADLRCGPQAPFDAEAAARLARTGRAPCQIHNNCSGKHAGFLTLSRHLGAGPEYVDPDHPVQRAVRAALTETTGDPDLGFGVDGCSAPNFALTLRGFATALAGFARPAEAFRGARAQAAERLTAAMIAHPDLVAGEGRACTAIMRALGGAAAVKTGAEGVFAAILPGPGLGVALKIDDGAGRAAEVALAAVLARLIPGARAALAGWLDRPQENWRGLVTGALRPAAALG